MKNFNTNNATKSLAIKKESSLATIHNLALESIRVSKKVVFAAFALTLLNMVV